MNDFGVVSIHGTKSGKISVNHVRYYNCININDGRSPIIHQRNILHKSFPHYSKSHFSRLTQSVNIGTTND